MIRGGSPRNPARIAARPGPAPRLASPVARPGRQRGHPVIRWRPLASWRPLNSARSRILGWSVVLLAAGIAVSTVATRVVLTQAMTTRVNAELAHEIAEFRALEARRGRTSHQRARPAGSAAAQGPLIALLRARARQAVLEHDTVLFGLIGGRIVATSSDTSPAAIGHSVLRTGWAATTGQPMSGSTQLASGQTRYAAVPVRLPGDPAHGVFVAAVLTGPQQPAIDRVLRWQLAVGAVALCLASPSPGSRRAGCSGRSGTPPTWPGASPRPTCPAGSRSAAGTKRPSSR